MQTVVAPGRVRIRISGAVQGVGFRPFVYRVARELGVSGWISNDPAGVIIEAEAQDDVLARFAERLRFAAPPHAVIHSLDVETLDPQHSREFCIRESAGGGARTAVVLPDIATCDDCRDELLDAADRRAGYPFINCTNCGPRYSIVRALPYDRVNTTMAGFTMCDRCRGEYRYPLDRRFHAQPNACPVCGPRVALCTAEGAAAPCVDPIAAAAEALRAGSIVAVKGLGGFHLMVDARNDAAVAALRERKHRPAKPFALMAASLAEARRIVDVDDVAAALLESPAAPIVLLPRRRIYAAARDVIAVADGIAPDNPYIGVMLPATPLHHLLMHAFGGPLVATSGNRSDEPICTDNHETFARLSGIADLFLVHDRPIERHVDDSVAMVSNAIPVLLRRARGYAPMPVLVAEPLPELLAAGPHMKNTIALSKGTQVFISQHIGDLETCEAQAAFERTTSDFLRLYEATPAAIVHDLHPDYISTRFAARLAARHALPAIAVQHHHAHMAAAMAENAVSCRTLGVVWDGTGYGSDGTIWGGEFLLGDAAAFTRAAHILPFRLPGGEFAIRRPRRIAAALLHAAGGAEAVLREMDDGPAPAPQQLAVLLQMLDTGLRSPVTTSMGRLLDGIAALLGLCRTATFEGEAAIRLEHVADAAEHGAYDVAITCTRGAPALLDWRPLLHAVLSDLRRGVPRPRIAARVHNGLVSAAAAVAELVGCDHVALSGGCFQNRILLERTAAALAHRGFRVLQHRRVPANDGGVSFGQIIVAAARLRTH
jgi:hydrogenase maturation protein HypF